MKAILMSIRPEWVAKILNGKKTIEIRKKFPKDYVGWVYIYCTKDRNNMLTKNASRNGYVTVMECIYPKHHLSHYRLNGKVVARFWCDNVEEIKYHIYGYLEHESECFLETKTLGRKELCCLAKLTYDDLKNYLKPKYKGYAIHITNLEIFDKPKEISEFTPRYEDRAGVYYGYQLTRAPQSFMFIEV